MSSEKAYDDSLLVDITLSSKNVVHCRLVCIMDFSTFRVYQNKRRNANKDIMLNREVQA